MKKTFAFLLPFEIVSRNHSHFRSGILNTQARKYKQDCKNHINQEYQNVLRQIDEIKQRRIKCIELEAVFLIRPSVLYTRNGDISKVSGDDDNLIKLPKDVLFASIGLDDSLVTKSTYTRISSDKTQVHKRIAQLMITIFYNEYEMAKVKKPKKTTKATKKPTKTIAKVMRKSSVSSGVRG